MGRQILDPDAEEGAKVLMDQEKIWTHFQGAGIRSFDLAEPRYDALAREVVKRAVGHHGRVLNIGIGGGGVEKRMMRSGWKVISVDPDKASVARMQALGVDARLGYAQKIPVETGLVDALVISEVLEHIPDENRPSAIAELARVLKPDGVLIGTVPYREDLSGSETVCPACGNVFHRWGHVASFDEQRLLAEMSPHFRVLRWRSRAFVNWRSGRSLRRFLKNGAKWILGRMGEGIVNPSLFFVARRRDSE
ncbi:MAG: hypothetical protein DMG16_19135 [Acidobacteria bacterium]|nr:MAG: hypothetical protein DMG16_19135 [Acidobacteriota bacterium]